MELKYILEGGGKPIPTSVVCDIYIDSKKTKKKYAFRKIILLCFHFFVPSLPAMKIDKTPIVINPVRHPSAPRLSDTKMIGFICYNWLIDAIYTKKYSLNKIHRRTNYEN